MTEIQEEAQAKVIELILDGAFDGEESILYDAIKERGKQIEARKAFTFKVGDTVIFNEKARPKYLFENEVKGVIKKINRTTAVVKLGDDAGRFAGGEPRCPLAIIDKVSS